MQIHTPEPPPRPGRKMLLRALLGGLTVMLLVGASVATAVVLEVKDDINIFIENSPPLPAVDTDPVPPSDPQTILVLGSDKRYADGPKGQAHSDTMMLVRLNPDKAATTVMSVPRDLQITLPGIGTEKLNASYFFGGPKLVVKTLKGILGTQAHPFKINHVVIINFGGFQKLLTKMGCVYVDVDRHYFNDNNPPAGGGGDYATINVKAGYQKLCGNSGLDYVRYRHFDDDLVRAARQQDFLRQAKDQLEPTKIWSQRKELLKLFAKNTQTDIRKEDQVLPLLGLVVNSATHPVQQVEFPVTEGPSFVYLQPEKLRATVRRFLNPAVSKSAGATSAAKKTAKKGKKKKQASTALAPGLTLNAAAGQEEAIPLANQVRFPVYYPTVIESGSQYVSSDRRAYNLRDRSDKKFQAYRIVVKTGLVGQYYGIQGTSWKHPPILDNPTGETKIDGRTFKLYGDGKRLQLVSWKNSRGVYWVSNTLLGKLTNKQMLSIAATTRKFG